jgi:signal transduction histidine kinase
VEQADRCKNIVGGLLNFARKNKVKLQEVDAFKFINKSIDSVVIPDNITIKAECKTDNPKAMFDSEQMMQVFTNLEKNAIEAMPEGGELKIVLEGDENNVNITFQDNGSGIKKENMDKLFTPFFTTKALGKGTGLGLPLVYGIIKVHNGKIKVESNANPEKGETGTKFIITLPRIN